MVYTAISLDEDEDFKILVNEMIWKVSDDKKKITKKFSFIDFKSSFAFMTRIALSAESLNHHPEWNNVYNNLEITWSTHDINGLSDLDIKMAQLCDEIYYKFT